MAREDIDFLECCKAFLPVSYKSMDNYLGPASRFPYLFLQVLANPFAPNQRNGNH